MRVNEREERNNYYRPVSNQMAEENVDKWHCDRKRDKIIK